MLFMKKNLKMILEWENSEIIEGIFFFVEFGVIIFLLEDGEIVLRDLYIGWRDDIFIFIEINNGCSIVYKMIVICGGWVKVCV